MHFDMLVGCLQVLLLELVELVSQKFPSFLLVDPIMSRPIGVLVMLTWETLRDWL